MSYSPIAGIVLGTGHWQADSEGRLSIALN
jgi:hypothetical protein